jgi:hypothetical protein
MHKTILILGLVFIISGCSTSTDLQTVSILNQRITSLENMNKVEHVDNPTKILSVVEDMEPEKHEQHDEHENTVIWLRMSNGGMLPIRFYIENGHWVGPLGDHYFHRPSKKQVELLYKK